MGVANLRQMIRKVSSNGALPCFALKMDIRKFFDSVHLCTLKGLLRQVIKDENALKMIDIIIDSFKANQGEIDPVGIPLGNVTSQLFANVYLHELDDFVKQNIKEKYYLRYSDDFIILSNNEEYLKHLISLIREFLAKNLRLELHPKKVFISKLVSGIDFLGYVLFENHTLMRTNSKQRMKRRLNEAYENYLIGKTDATPMDQKLQSYLGILSHADQQTLSIGIKNAYWVRNGSFPD